MGASGTGGTEPSERLSSAGYASAESASVTDGGAVQDYDVLCRLALARLEAGDAAASVTASRRALDLLPRGLDAHRLLGLALLEGGETRPALSAFQVALAGDPLDAVAQAGIAQAQEQIGGSASVEAEWLRTWELQPGRGPIEDRLQAARVAAGGAPTVEPYPLTSAALARVYLRSGLFEHAVAESRAALQRQPDRADLHLTLAEAFWRSGDGTSAAAVAEDLLERLPDCAAANLLLAAHWQTIGRDPATLLARVRAVDPVGYAAGRLFGDREASPPLDGIEIFAGPAAAPVLGRALAGGGPPAPSAPPVDEPANVTEAAEVLRADAMPASAETSPTLPEPLPMAPETTDTVPVAPAMPGRGVERSRSPATGVAGKVNAQPGEPVAEVEPEPAFGRPPHLSVAPVEVGPSLPPPAALTAPVTPEAPALADAPVAPVAQLVAEPAVAAAPEPLAPVVAPPLPAPEQSPVVSPTPASPPVEPVVPESVVPAPVASTPAPAGSDSSGSAYLQSVIYLQGAAQLQEAGDAALRARKYVEAIRHYGAALRRLRSGADGGAPTANGSERR